jgi:hypothetical protein
MEKYFQNYSNVIIVQGPSIKYFYENKARLQTQEWWILDVVEQACGRLPESFPESGIDFTAIGDLGESCCFHEIAYCLFYDLVGFISHCSQPTPS